MKEKTQESSFIKKFKEQYCPVINQENQQEYFLDMYFNTFFASLLARFSSGVSIAFSSSFSFLQGK